MQSKFALIGQNIKRSPSPAMHIAAFRMHKFDYDYKIMEILDIKTSEKRLRSLSGFNVTAPFKESILEVLDDIDAQSENIGAVNTVVKDQGNLIGHNTDWKASILSLRSRIDPAGKNIAIIGAGGTSRAVAFALKDSNVTVFNRDSKRRKRLTSDLGCASDGLKNFSGKWDILINTTPVRDVCVVPSEYLKNVFVFDVSYSGSATLEAAKKAGCDTLDGRQMLARQAAASFSLWTGHNIDYEFMLDIAKKTLRRI